MDKKNFFLWIILLVLVLCSQFSFGIVGFRDPRIINNYYGFDDNINISGNLTADNIYANNLFVTNFTTSYTYNVTGSICLDDDCIDDWSNVSIPFENVYQKNKIGDPFHIDDLQEVHNHMNSAGILHNCSLTDNGDGTINISDGYAFLRSENDSHSTLYSVFINAQSNINLPYDINYVYVNFNGGSPIFEVGGSDDDFNCLDKCIAYIGVVEDNVFHYIDGTQFNVDTVAKNRKMFIATEPFKHELGGSAIGGRGLNVTLTSGAFWYVNDRYPHDSFDSDIMSFNYYFTEDSGVTWNKTSSNIINNLEYNDVTFGLTTLGNNKIKVDWVYEVNNEPSFLVVVYGDEEYDKLSDAEGDITSPAYLPSLVQSLGVLVGKVIVEKSSSQIETQTSVGLKFSSGTSVVHNGLSGLQGCITDECYHLNLAQHTELTAWLNSVILSSNGNINMSNSTLIVNNVLSDNWGNISHTQIQDIGSNTHSQIDAHLSDVINPHSANLEQTNISGLDTLGVTNDLNVNVQSGDIIINGRDASSGIIDMRVDASGVFQRGVGLNLYKGSIGIISGVDLIKTTVSSVGGSPDRALYSVGDSPQHIFIDSASTYPGDLYSTLGIQNNVAFNQQFSIKTSATTNAEANLFQIFVTGSGTTGNFLNFKRSTGSVFAIDTIGNVKLTKGLISPRIGSGELQNMLKFSEQLDNSMWVKNGCVVTGDYIDSPDGTPLIADRITGTGTVKQTSTGITAGKTFTFSLWYRNNGASNTQGIRIDSGNETGTARSLGSSFHTSGHWYYETVTQTFTAGSIGSPTIVIIGSSADMSVFGASLSETTSHIPYVATTNESISNGRGVVVNGKLKISGGYEPTQIILREGGNQSINNLFEVQDKNGNVKINIDNDFNLNITNNITAGELHSMNGFTGDCLNISFVDGVAVGCND